MTHSPIRLKAAYDRSHVNERGDSVRYLVVELQAEHYCLSARGSRQPGHRLATRVSRGVLDEDRALREEALGLLEPQR